MASERSLLERATKSAVLLSTLGAVTFQALDAGRALWFIPPLALLAALAAFTTARVATDRTAPIVLAIGYAMPALILISGIGFRYTYLSIWMAAFLGATAAPLDASVLTWRYPARLIFPLVGWALVIAVSWPIVALRVLDWSPVVLWRRPPTPSVLVYAVQSAVWISHVASVQLFGLLWMDWLFARFSGTDIDRFERLVIAPLLIMATVSGLLSVYQGFVDLRFLSLGTWSDLGRATGAQADGNASGALTGLWIAVALCTAIATRNRPVTIAAALSAGLLAAATYASGSRTAALCAAIALLAVVHVVAIARWPRRRLAIAGAVALLVTMVAWQGLSSAAVTGPLRRVSELLPDLSAANLRSAAQKLWEREGYGTSGVMMIEEQPLQGVGIGAFHLLTPDYVFASLHRVVPSDNSQNWFRHQLAELGLLGSVGLMWWSAVLAAAVFLGRTASARPISSLAAKYTLAGFGLASLLGMPSQNLFVSVTVWTFAFWLLLTVPTDASRSPDSLQRRWLLTAAVAIAVSLGGATIWAGWRDLRPPALAKRFNYLYEYGVYESVDHMAGSTQTSGHSVSVISAPTARLKLTVWVDHPDANRNPVQVDIWADGRRIVHGRFGRGVPLVRIVDLPGQNRRFILETRVDRTYADVRRSEIGLNLDWEFLKDPP